MFSKTTGFRHDSIPDAIAAGHTLGDRQQAVSSASSVPLPDPWVRTDEWSNFRTNPRDTPDSHVLASLDAASYSGGTMGDHPIAWYHSYAGGRAWYTAGGHTSESYSEALFLAHLLGGIEYAATCRADQTR